MPTEILEKEVKTKSKQAKIFLITYNLFFLVSSIYVVTNMILNTKTFFGGILTLTFIFHWWIGTLVFLNLPQKKQIDSFANKMIYFAIFSTLFSSIILFYKPIHFLVLLGVAFLLVIPLYKQMINLKNPEYLSFIKIKYILEYIGGFGFIIGAYLIYQRYLPEDFIFISGSVIHIIILGYLFITKKYQKTIKNLGVKFF